MLFRVLFAAKLQAHWVRLLPPRFAVSSEPVVLPLPPSPVPLRDRVHPLVSFSSTSEFQPLLTCPTPRCEDAFLGVLFPFATSVRRVHLQASFPVLALWSVLSVSRALDGLLLFEPCGFISPRCHVRDSPLRGLIPLPSRITSSVTRALLSLGGSLLPLGEPNGSRSFRLAFRALIQAAILGHRQRD